MLAEERGRRFCGQRKFGDILAKGVRALLFSLKVFLTSSLISGPLPPPPPDLAAWEKEGESQG